MTLLNYVSGALEVVHASGQLDEMLPPEIKKLLGAT